MKEFWDLLTVFLLLLVCGGVTFIPVFFILTSQVRNETKCAKCGKLIGYARGVEFPRFGEPWFVSYGGYIEVVPIFTCMVCERIFCEYCIKYHECEAGK